MGVNHKEGYEREQRQEEVLVPFLHLLGSPSGWAPPMALSRTMPLSASGNQLEGATVSTNGSLVVTKHLIHQLRA